MMQVFQEEEKNFPYTLKYLDQMIRDTMNVLDNKKGLIVTVGYSGLTYASKYYLKPLRKKGIKFQLAKLYQTDDIIPGRRSTDLSSTKTINPIGCYKAIIFDNSTKSFKSLAGAYDYILPRCHKWGIDEVYAFIMIDENGGSNSTAVPLYQRYGIPYKGPLHVFREKSPNLFRQLDSEKVDESSNKRLTELISSWASPVHSSVKLMDKIDKGVLGVTRKILNVTHRPPKPNFENLLSELYDGRS